MHGQRREADLPLSTHFGSPPTTLPPLPARPRPQALAPPSGPPLLCVQWLNVGIFQAIGHAGVYYGFKLGHTVPWVDGFPFNLGVPHPQYVGSVATVAGMAALVSDAVAAGGNGGGWWRQRRRRWWFCVRGTRGAVKP